MAPLPEPQHRTVDWARVEELFEAALEQPDDTRRAWLEAACAGEPALLAEVWSLLEADGSARGFVGSAVRKVASEISTTAGDELGSGTRLGPWRIAHEIGRGGMGVVYLAERADGEYEQRIAIKVFGATNRSDAVRARFRQERQILARLNHPWIVRLIDGGDTPGGRPWFAMEYVRGAPITHYCEAMHLALRDRVELLARVCDVVRFAHQNLVVHRDLKPGNILIAADGTPRLLDFGIARILETEPVARAANPTVFARAMTPHYASPEQVRGEPATVSMDVYALGALLYELITGKPPHKITSFTPADLHRAICETPVELPSIAAARNQRHIPKALSRDVDAIAMKALEKSDARRYSSAEHLANDLRRCVEGAAVEARGASVLYRARRQFRRHWFALGAPALLLCLLTASTSLLYLEKRTAENRFQQVRALADDLLFGVYDSISDIPGATKARLVVVEAALKRLDALAREAGNDASLDRQLMYAYMRAGDVLGHPGQANLGRIDDALVSYGKALGFATQLEKRSRRDPELLSELVHLRFLIAKVKGTQGERTAAQAEYKNALAYLESLPSDIVRTPVLQDRVVQILQELSRDQLSEEGVATAYKAVTLMSPDSGDIKREVAFGDAVHALALNLRRQGRMNEARQYYERLLELRKRTVERSPGNATLQRMLAIAWGSFGDSQLNDDPARNGPVALPSFQRAAAITERLAAADSSNHMAHLDVANALFRVGMAWPASDPSGAVEVFGRTADALTAVLRREPRNVQARGLQLRTWAMKGELLVAMGRTAEGRDLLRRTITEAEAWCDKYPLDLTPRQALLNSYVALARLQAKDPDTAMSLARRAIESNDNFRDPSRRARAFRARIYATSADLAARSGRHNADTAARWYTRAVEEWTAAGRMAPLNGEDSDGLSRARSALGKMK